MSKRNEYQEYLRSDEWRDKSAHIRHERGNRCEYCGKPAGVVILHCHHMTYERFGNELPADLLILCEMHHSGYHKDYPGSKMPKLPAGQLKRHVLEVLDKQKRRRPAIKRSKKRSLGSLLKKKGLTDDEKAIIKQKQGALLGLARKSTSSKILLKCSDHSDAIANLKKRQSAFRMGSKTSAEKQAENRRRKLQKRKRRKANKKRRQQLY